MTLRHWVLGAALLGSASLVLFSEPAASPAVSEAVARPAAHEGAAAAVTATPTEPPMGILKLQDRARLMGARSNHRAAELFQAQSWAPADSGGGLLMVKPVAPPLPFAYAGQQTEDDELVVFLVSSDTTYVARVGDVLEGVYRVEHITPSAMTLVYLPLQERQALPLE